MTRPAIMWFRQDLRLADNAALTAAAASGPVLCVYILDDETPGTWRMGGASRWWLHGSLEQLATHVPLVLRRGPADRVIAALLSESCAESVHFMREFAPWSPALEDRIREVCEAAGATAQAHGGFLLHEPDTIRNGSGRPYRVYGAFASACLAAGEPHQPRPKPTLAAWDGSVLSEALDDLQLRPRKPDWAAKFGDYWKPGEAGGRSRLASFTEDALDGYTEDRDRPGRAGGSRLSAHLHFGEVSPAQCWHAIRAAAARAGGEQDTAAEKFLRELLWREFSYHLLSQFPELPEKPFKSDFAAFPWTLKPAHLAAWQRGLTGYSLVDAGMRELWATGSMHNRVRMIAASFLVKHLLISWTEGVRWFWDTLVDADMANNSASWQWVAGTGADASPYFRIFNPVLQGEKFDPDGSYVRRWVPELQAMPNSYIHRPWEAPAAVLKSARVELGVTYPRPIVDHKQARVRALAALKAMKEPTA